MIEPTVAFIRIRRFGLKTAEEFTNAIIELKKQGAKNLILDLRDNGGGYFHVAIKLASEFFADQRLVVYTEGRMKPVAITCRKAKETTPMQSW